MNSSPGCGRRVRSALMFVGALVLFLAGLFLLFAPAAAQDPKSQMGNAVSVEMGARA